MLNCRKLLVLTVLMIICVTPFTVGAQSGDVWLIDTTNERLVGALYDYKMEHYESSLFNIDEYLKTFPGDPDAWHFKGLICRKLGDYDACLECFDKALELNPKFGTAWYDKAMLLLLRAQSPYSAPGDGNEDEAIRCLQNAVKFGPECVKGKAQEILSAADKLPPISYVYPTDSDEELPTTAEAGDDTPLPAPELPTEEPQSAEEWFIGAINDYNMGSYDSALSKINEYLETFPDDPNALNFKSVILLTLKKYEVAKEILLKVVDIDEDNTDAMTNLGTAYYSLKRYDDATRCYNNVLETDPNHEFAWNGLGDVYREKCEFAEATRCYNKAIAINPESGKAHYFIGMILLSQRLQVQDKAGEVTSCLKNAIKFGSSDVANTAQDILDDCFPGSYTSEESYTLEDLDLKSVSPDDSTQSSQNFDDIEELHVKSQGYYTEVSGAQLNVITKSMSGSS